MRKKVLDIHMLRHMFGPTIKGGRQASGNILGNGHIEGGQSLSLTNTIEPGSPETWLVEYAMDVGSPHQSIGRHGAIALRFTFTATMPLNHSETGGARKSMRDTHVNLIAQNVTV